MCEGYYGCFLSAERPLPGGGSGSSERPPPRSRQRVPSTGCPALARFPSPWSTSPVLAQRIPDASQRWFSITEMVRKPNDINARGRADHLSTKQVVILCGERDAALPGRPSQRLKGDLSANEDRGPPGDRSIGPKSRVFTLLLAIPRDLGVDLFYIQGHG